MKDFDAAALAELVQAASRFSMVTGLIFTEDV